MVSELMRRVMKECLLDQKGLADVLGVPLQRVKNLTAGNVKKLTREETESLVRKLSVRGDWLATGEGEMFQEVESQDSFIARQQSIARMNQLINAMPLPAMTRQRLCLLMTGDALQDGPLIAEMLLDHSGVHQAVLDAVDLLSLGKKVDAEQLAKAVVKLCGNRGAGSVPSTGSSQTQTAKFEGSMQIFHQAQRGDIAGRDIVKKSKK